MKFFDPNNPNEKKKMIAAGVLGLVAILILGYVFLGGSSSKPPSNRVTTVPSPAPPRGPNTTQPPDPPPDEISNLRPVVFTGTVASVTEGDRNIFAITNRHRRPHQGPLFLKRQRRHRHHH